MTGILWIYTEMARVVFQLLIIQTNNSVYVKMERTVVWGRNTVVQIKDVWLGVLRFAEVRFWEHPLECPILKSRIKRKETYILEVVLEPWKHFPFPNRKNGVWELWGTVLQFTRISGNPKFGNPVKSFSFNEIGFNFFLTLNFF